MCVISYIGIYSFMYIKYMKIMYMNKYMHIYAFLHTYAYMGKVFKQKFQEKIFPFTMWHILQYFFFLILVTITKLINWLTVFKNSDLEDYFEKR